LHLNKYHTTNTLTLFNGHRFTFNGKEADNDVYGTGNAMDFGARIYDSRLGRWLSVDPLQRKYPDLTPYNYTGNSPIVFVDKDGRDLGLNVTHAADGKIGTIIIVANVYTTNKEAYNQALAASNDLKSVQKTAIIDGKEYAVSFQVNVTLSDNKAEAMKEVRQTDPIGNLYKGTTGSKEFLDGKAVGGETAGGRETDMNMVSYDVDQGTAGMLMQTHNAGDNAELVAHEFLHYMGVSDTDKGGPKGGRMEYVANPGNGFDMKDVSHSDITAIINYAIQNDGKINKKTDPNAGAQATITQTGEGDIKKTNSIEIK
jgi:RHS repeat-associated protein